MPLPMNAGLTKGKVIENWVWFDGLDGESGGELSWFNDEEEEDSGADSPLLPPMISMATAVGDRARVLVDFGEDIGLELYEPGLLSDPLQC